MINTFKPRHIDPFKPVLLSAQSESLNVSQEQMDYIRWILDKSCSDTQFARKAYDSIHLVLTVGLTPTPEIESLSPSSVSIGSPTFDISVHGKNFIEGSKIIFNGFEEPTTVVSDTELQTGVNMDVWLAPAVVPIMVQTPDGVTSNSMNFEFTSVSVSRSDKSDKGQAGDGIHSDKSDKLDKEPGHRIIDVPKVDHSIKSKERTPHEIAEDIRQKIKDKDRKDMDSHLIPTSQIPSHQIQSVPPSPFPIPSPHFNPDRPPTMESEK